MSRISDMLGTETYTRYAEQFAALLTAEKVAAGNVWVRIGRLRFRASPSAVMAANGQAWSWSKEQPRWEAEACWGRYVYAVPVEHEGDAIALALGLAGFTSRSAGRGRRSDIKLVWR